MVEIPILRAGSIHGNTKSARLELCGWAFHFHSTIDFEVEIFSITRKDFLFFFQSDSNHAMICPVEIKVVFCH